MSSFKNPVGPQPSTVYWRRRLGVIGALLLVVIVIVLIAVRPGAGSSAAPVPTSTTPTPGAAAAPQSQAPAASAPATKPAAAATTPPATPAGPVACTAADITLKAVADRSNYSSLQQPQISMSVGNRSSASCTIDLGSSQQVLTVTSGGEKYWSSKDCQVNGTHQTVTLTPGQTLNTPAIAWDRTRSSTSTCDSTRSSVPAAGASYHLGVAVGTIHSSNSALMILN